MVIDVSTIDSRKVLIGALLLLFFGISGLIGAVTEDDYSIAMWIVGGIFTLLGIFAADGWRRARKPARVVFEPLGIRYEHDKLGWSIAWSELNEFSVYAVRGVRSDWPTQVNLDLVPRDPNFGEQRPELGFRWRTDEKPPRLRQNIGQVWSEMNRITGAANQFAPWLFRGVYSTRGSN